MTKTQVKLLTKYISDQPVSVCVLNMKGEEIHQLFIKDYCCAHTIYVAALRFLEENNMVEIHNEVV